MRRLTDKEKVQVYKKLSIWFRKQTAKADSDIVNIVDTSFSQTTCYYIFGSEAVKKTKIPVTQEEEDSDDDALPSHSRAESVLSIDVESQTQNAQSTTEAQTATSPKRKSSNDHEKAQKKTKTQKSEAIKKFLTDFALAERPVIEISPITEEEVKQAEVCDSKEQLIIIIKKNVSRLNSTQLDEIQIRLLIGKQISRLRYLFGSRKSTKDFEEYVKHQIGLSRTTFKYYSLYLELLEKYKLFQQIPHSFREIRNSLGGILDWLDGDEAKELPVENVLSTSYWKTCPSQWKILPPELARQNSSLVLHPPRRMSYGATISNPPQHSSAPPSPPTDESISRSMSSTSLHDDDIEVPFEQFDDYMDAKKRAHQNDFIPFIVPARIKALKAESNRRNTVTAD